MNPAPTHAALSSPALQQMLAHLEPPAFLVAADGNLLSFNPAAQQALAAFPSVPTFIHDLLPGYNSQWLEQSDILRKQPFEPGNPLRLCRVFGGWIIPNELQLVQIETEEAVIAKNMAQSLIPMLSGLFIVVESGDIIWHNARFIENIGCAENKRFEEIFRENLASMLNGQEKILLLSNVKGQQYPTRVSVVPTTYTFEDQACYLGMVQRLEQAPINEQDAELAFRLLQETSESTRTGGWYLNLETGRTYFTKITKDIHELGPNDLLDVNSGLKFFKAGVARKKIQAAVQDLIAHGSSYQLELPFITAKKNARWVRVSGRPHFENGKITAIYGAMQDITEERKKIDTYRNLSESLNAMVNALPDLIFKFNAKNEITYCHADQPDDLYLPPANFIGKSIAAVLPPEVSQLIIEKTEEARKTGKRVNFTYLLGKKWYEARALQLNKQEVLAVVRNITDLKLAQANLEKTNLQLQLHNERLSNFAHIVSHNLRSHTANIQGLVAAIDMELELNEKLQMIELLRVPANLLNTTIKALNQVVSMPRTVGEGMEAVAIKPIAEGLMRLVENDLAACEGRIELHIASQLKVKAVPAFLEGILQNLLTNAIKYRSANRQLHIVISAEKVNDMVVIQVKDTGSGIDMAKFGNRLFGLYKTFHGNQDALGLGLFMSKNQVEHMGGRIAMESQVHQGSTVSVWLQPA